MMAYGKLDFGGTSRQPGTGQQARQIGAERLEQQARQLQAENMRLKDLIVAVSNDLESFSEKLIDNKQLFESKMMELRQKKQGQRQEVRFEEAGGEGNKMFIIHEQWKVVITIMSGIEMSVLAFDYERKQYTPMDRDFKTKNTFDIHHAALEQYKRAEFVDYAPTIFHYLRKISDIFPEAYLESLGPDSLSKIIMGNSATFEGSGSAGKSGSFFFTSSDKRFLVKSISEEEFRLIMDILPRFFKFMTENPQTLLSRVFGLHRIRMKSLLGIDEEWIIIVMQNIFSTNVPIDRRFDLKGSTYKRLTPEDKLASGVGKDLNFLDQKL